MIFNHIIAGFIPVDNFKFSWLWLLGSVIADVDHLFVLIYYKIFSWKKIVDLMLYEEKYKISLRTKYLHSVLGALVLSFIVFWFSAIGSIFFFAGYLFHLLLDWPDKDAKQYLYPFKKEFKGFLPIFSKTEKIFACTTLILLILIYAFIYFYK